MDYFMILGARDPEMGEIARVLEENNIGYTYAIHIGSQVEAFEAYHATGVQGLIPKDAKLVFVECEVVGLTPYTICDHHNEGDPGYGLPPERYMEGSSLGQVLALLGLEPTPKQKIIAAADHCLRPAYAGECPGVDPVELGAWRESSRAEVRGISIEEIRERIEVAMDALRKAPRIKVAGDDVAWFPLNAPLPSEVSDASARLGIPFCYIRRDKDVCKSGIKSASKEAILEWMRECGLQGVYGVPERGFAGGYFSSKFIKDGNSKTALAS